MFDRVTCLGVTQGVLVRKNTESITYIHTYINLRKRIFFKFLNTYIHKFAHAVEYAPCHADLKIQSDTFHHQSIVGLPGDDHLASSKAFR